MIFKYDVNNDKFEVVELLGITALFTEDRIFNDWLPEGLYAYDLSEDDNPDTFLFATIENSVDFGKHAGTVITAQPIDLGESGCISFDDLPNEDYPGFDGRYMSIIEYLDIDGVLTDDALQSIWDSMEDVPIDPDTECMEQPYFIFPAGINRMEIWKWFDKHHSKGVRYLLYGEEA